MANAYIDLIVFAIVAAMVPIGMLLVSRLLSRKMKRNDILLDNYESAEMPIGDVKDITNDYLYYFPIFIAFELLIVALIFWSFVYSGIGIYFSAAVMLMLILGTIATFISLKFMERDYNE
jgi:NADH:ubiquinone oxidoreductase subunit 3 (subunit A)